MKPCVIHWHTRPIVSVKTNYDGDLMLTCAKDGLVCLGYTKNGERIGTYGDNGTTKIIYKTSKIADYDKHFFCCLLN